MNKIFRNKNNNNFYHIKELQWSNKASKLNSYYPKVASVSNSPKFDPFSYQQEKSWNNRFIYSKIPKYDAAQDKNVIDPNLLKIPSMNCYYNAIKSNTIINSHISSSKKRIRGKIPSSCHKSNEKTYLNCSAKFKSGLFSQNSSSKDIFININNNNRMFSPSINNNNNQNKKNEADKLIKLWNDLCVLEPYRELFNIILDQLNDERKSDLYEREFNELFELKNNIKILSTNVFYRLKTLEELNNLNDKLGLILKSKQTSSNEVVLKNISKKIENLREYTVNICFYMKKVKEKINAGHPWGKFDFDSISEKYKFDKNYLIKMKEEMYVLREGYAKYFFNIGDDNTPFLLNASQPPNNNRNIDPFMHIVPLDNVLKENINQSIYIIYQELIGYQNYNVSESSYKNISPLKKYKYNDIETKLYKIQKDNLNSNKSSMSDRWTLNKGLSSATTFNPEQIKSENNFSDNKRILSGGESIGNNNAFNKYFNSNENINNRVNQKSKNDIRHNDYQDNKNNSINNCNNGNDNNMVEKEKEEDEDNNKTNLINEKKGEEKNDKIIIKKYEKIIEKNNKEEKKDNETNISKNKSKDKMKIEKDLIDNDNKKEKSNNNSINNNKSKINTSKNNLESDNIKLGNTSKNMTEDNIINGINNNINGDKINNNNNNINNNEKTDEINNNNLNHNKSNDNISNISKNKINYENKNNNTSNNKINIEKSNETNEDKIIKINLDEKNESYNKREDQINGSNHNSNNIEENKEIDKVEVDKSINSDINKSRIVNSKNVNDNNNQISDFLKSKKLKVKVYTDDLNNFSKDFYDYYYQLIPSQIKEMFKTQNNIVPNLLKGVSPYLIIIYDEIPGEHNNWMYIRNNIFGICTINYEYKNSKLKIIINHISTSIKFDKEKNKYYLNDIKHIFNLIIQYIKDEFYFDEIIINYDNNKTNEEILNLFLNEFNFTIINETELEENEEEENTDNNNKIKEEQENKLVYVNDTTKNNITQIIRQSPKSYLGKNIFSIFNSILVTNNTNRTSTIQSESNTNKSYHYHKSQKNNIKKMNKTFNEININFDENLVNVVSTNYLLEIKEERNIKKLYSKISKLDQLIKVFQNNKIKKDEIPLTIAQNIFDILSCVINKNLIINSFNNSFFFSNYNTNNPSSYLDKKSGIFYNYIKPGKIYVFQNEKFKIKFYHIINNNLSLFFCNINNDDIINYLNKKNIYTQMNEIYKQTINENKKEILDDKIIWIPCFEIYNHFKCLSKNAAGTIHEYVKISNKKIKKLNFEQFRINNKDNSQVIIEPDTSRDILFNNDFIFGLINNADILIDENKKNNNKDSPYIVFLSNVYKSNFIKKS